MKLQIKKNIKSLSIKQIILSMVEGLRNPTTKINMDTYGEVENKICYGCAATNTICMLLGITVKDLLNGNGRAHHLTNSSKKIKFLNRFESAIDDLRTGDYHDFLFILNKLGWDITNYKNLDPDLPYLDTNYTEKELKAYENFANSLPDPGLECELADIQAQINEGVKLHEQEISITIDKKQILSQE